MKNGHQTLTTDYDMNTNLVAELVQLCVLLQETTLTEDADKIKWVLSVDGKCSTKSTYSSQFEGQFKSHTKQYGKPRHLINAGSSS